MKTYYIIQLFSKNENWTYTDDYYRTVEFYSEKDAKKQIEDIFSWGAEITSAKIIRVTKEEVSEIKYKPAEVEQKG